MNLSICTKQKYKRRDKDLGLLPFTPHLLSQALGCYLRTAKKHPTTITATLLNWGMSKIVGLENYDTILNHPDNVLNAINKRKALDILTDAGVPTLVYTYSKKDAEDWMKVFNERDDDYKAGEEELDTVSDRFLTGKIVCRTLITSSAGKGIVLADKPEELVDAPLYTIYYKKNKEYRYHILGGRVLDVQQKKRLSKEELESRGFTTRPPSYIRNLANGYIFAREGVESVPEISEVAINAVKALELDFGAVDMLVNTDSDGKYIDCCVCEVNTAPGLTGTTFELYKSEFKTMFGDNNE